MESNNVIVIAVIMLLAFTAFQMTQIRSLKKSITSVTGSAVQGQIDTTGWTQNEIMNYEMHGTIPARLKQSTPSQSQMVGGC